MRPVFFRFLCIVTTLCLTLTSYTSIQGSGSGDQNGSNRGVSASAYASETSRLQGANWYTDHRARSYARANTYAFVNGSYYYNSGSYTIGAELNGGLKDSDGRYYSGQMSDNASVSRTYSDTPSNVSGWGDADSTVYGAQNISASAYDYTRF